MSEGTAPMFDESTSRSTTSSTTVDPAVGSGEPSHSPSTCSSGIPASLEPPGGLLQFLLGEQQTLTAVEEFSRAHDADTVPAQAKYYSKLLPASPPGPGQQYGFDVDLDQCSGCKACVTACHSMNGLDETEAWRDVGLLVGGTSTNPVMQHVTTACHHCLEPACMIGCPVNAYEKDPVTGIVRHLDDQCFGCEYCTLACPYDVPKYHAAKGIVRKCDMCSQRLAADEAPACVQACPHGAIAIRIVDRADVTGDGSLVPEAPDSRITSPTTTYRTTRLDLSDARPADADVLRPQHAHVPLFVMLVLTQLAFGAFLAGQLVGTFATASPTFARGNATLATVSLLAALAASTLHLGRPLYAFRGVLGWRHSWLSREIVAFGAFAGVAVPFAVAHWVELPFLSPGLVPLLGWGTVVTGAVGVFCSIMIYVFTKREVWSFPRTTTRFLLTSLVLGIGAALLVSSLGGSAELVRALGMSVIGASVAKLLFDAAILRRAGRTGSNALARSARVMTGPLLGATCCRFACGLLGGVLLPCAVLFAPVGASLVTPLVGSGFLLCIVGEMCERYLFFAAAAPPRMPGGPFT